MVMSDQTNPPEWVELLPAGVDITGFDGRQFKNEDPTSIVKMFKDHPNYIPIDWEHATELKAPEGEEAPAAGWIVDLEERPGGSIWGHVEWTPRGAQSVASKEYRYISPAFINDKKSNKIIKLVSAGLTNKPNLELTALAREDAVQEKQLKVEVTMDPKILALLGLTENATQEQVTAAIEALKAGASQVKALQESLNSARADLNRAQTPDLTRFVPRSDYEVMLNRAQAAENAIKSAAEAKLKADIEAEVDAAMKLGKISPAARDFYVASCSQEGGLDRFREFVKVAAVIVPQDGGVPSVVPELNASALTDVQLEVATRCGLSKEVYLAAMKSS